jgi:hypothetical protein
MYPECAGSTSNRLIYTATRPHGVICCKTTHNILILLRPRNSKTITTTLKHNAIQPSQRPLLKVPLPGNWDCPYLFYTQPSPLPLRCNGCRPRRLTHRGAFALLFSEYDLPYKILNFLSFPRAVGLWASLSKLLFWLWQTKSGCDRYRVCAVQELAGHCELCDVLQQDGCGM